MPVQKLLVKSGELVHNRPTFWNASKAMPHQIKIMIIVVNISFSLYQW